MKPLRILFAVLSISTLAYTLVNGSLAWESSSLAEAMAYSCFLYLGGVLVQEPKVLSQPQQNKIEA